MKENLVRELLEYIKFYSDSYEEVETPCERILGELGSRGVDAVAELMRDSIRRDDHSVASYSAHLLVKSGLPGSVEALTEMVIVAIGSTPLPDESLAAIFDDALPYDRFLTNPQFLSAARELSRRWNNSGLDRFIATADQRVEGK